ncbi:MAG: DNA cytosine methyltransferase [Bacteroidales bacterium]|nr:DNA cytosine methyltransferase [Bacteroidales bacterium]
MSRFLKITNIEFVRRDIPQGGSGGTGYCEYDIVKVCYDNGVEHTATVPAYYNNLNTAWEEFYKDIVSCSNPEEAYMLFRAAIGGDVWDSSFDDLRDSFKSPKPMPQKVGKKIYRIRRLTSRECFRLMGVSDADIDKIQHYPHILNRKGEWVFPKGITNVTSKKMTISESQQYKMAGNSIVVQVLEGIFTQLFRKDSESLF